MALYEVKYAEGEAIYTFVPVAGAAPRQAATTAPPTKLESTAERSQEPEKYTCDKCGLQFVSEVRLEWHRSTHEPLKNCKPSKKHCKPSDKLKFICPTCEFSTSERQLMIDHFTAKHCTMITADAKSASEQPLAEDERVEELEMTELTCAQCGFSSYDQDDLDFHTCSKPGGEESSSSFSCHLCTYECFTRMGLQSHITRKHKPKPGTGEVPARYSCDQCDYECANKSTLYSHKRKHRSKSKPRQSKPRQPPKRNSLQRRKEKGQEDSGRGRRRVQCTFFCNECDYSSAKKSALFQHIKRAAGHGKQPRDQSFQAAVQPGSRRSKGQLFSCDQCPYTNKNRYEMKVHVIRKHSNEYNYECEQCGKKYKIKGDLTNHIRFQHREQPIICDVCGKTCGNSNSLYVHQKFAHYKAEFECHICHRRMVSQANLDEHVLKQHEQREDAICEECGKTFTRQSRLKIHMRIHLGIKPHACKLCGKAFSRKTALRQHLLIHTGQRPYLCDICGKSFTQKPGLISHRKSHPGTHPPLPRVTIDHVLSDLLSAQ